VNEIIRRAEERMIGGIFRRADGIQRAAGLKGEAISQTASPAKMHGFSPAFA